MNDPAVRLTNVSKRYKVADGSNSLFRNWRNSTRGDFWALRDVNFLVKRGERVGILGANGAGKTTLLKIISGITKPTTGSISIYGKVVSLIDLEAGFQPDLTGEENIYLNGALIGIPRPKLKRSIAAIQEFSGIRNFLKAPFYTYSDGMKFRLAFSIAVKSEFDILVMDEIFMAGDIEFQRKTVEKIKEIQATKKVTTIICSHSPLYVGEFSTTFHLLDHGKLQSLSSRQLSNQILRANKIWLKSFSRTGRLLRR